jgi:ribosomal protein L33
MLKITEYPLVKTYQVYCEDCNKLISFTIDTPGKCSGCGVHMYSFLALQTRPLSKLTFHKKDSIFEKKAIFRECSFSDVWCRECSYFQTCSDAEGMVC